VSRDPLTQTNVGTVARRAAALSLGTAVGSLVAPATAVPDSSSWSDPENPSLMGSLLLIGGPVIAIIVIIAVLTYLPSMMRRGDSGEIAYNDPEWFGGPRTGVKPDAKSAPESGGSSGRW
jgi:hypothetical protein